jgi:metal-dependent amidase/aminoacylase/carboxypeptidase family protein
MADQGPNMEFGGMSGAAASEMQAVKAAGGETLITALAGTLNTGRVTKTISFIAAMAPSFFFNLGGMPKGTDPRKAGPHHTPDFYLDESGFIVGVKAFCQLVFDYGKTK